MATEALSSVILLGQYLVLSGALLALMTILIGGLWFWYAYLVSSWITVRHFLRTQRIKTPWYKGWGFSYYRVIDHALKLSENNQERKNQLTKFYKEY
jgi:hypothetical protein